MPFYGVVAPQLYCLLSLCCFRFDFIAVNCMNNCMNNLIATQSSKSFLLAVLIVFAVLFLFLCMFVFVCGAC